MQDRKKRSGGSREVYLLLKDKKKSKVEDQAQQPVAAAPAAPVVPPAPVEPTMPLVRYVTRAQQVVEHPEEELIEREEPVKKSKNRSKGIKREIDLLNQIYRPRKPKAAKAQDEVVEQAVVEPAPVVIAEEKSNAAQMAKDAVVEKAAQSLENDLVENEVDRYVETIVQEVIKEASERALYLAPERNMLEAMAAFINDDQAMIQLPVQAPQHPTQFTAERAEVADILHVMHGSQSNHNLDAVLQGVEEVESMNKLAADLLAVSLEGQNEAEVQAPAAPVAPVLLNDPAFSDLLDENFEDYNDDYSAKLLLKVEDFEILDEIEQMQERDRLHKEVMEFAAIFQAKEEKLGAEMAAEAEKLSQVERQSVTKLSLFKAGSDVPRLAKDGLLRALKKLAKSKDFTAQVNSITSENETPLYLATRSGHVRVVEMLLPFCTYASINQKANSGSSAYDLIVTDLFDIKNLIVMRALIQTRLEQLEEQPEEPQIQAPEAQPEAQPEQGRQSMDIDDEMNAFFEDNDRYNYQRFGY